MNLQVHNTTTGLISRLQTVIEPGTEALLVGGVVRDQLSGIPCHDIDIILRADAKQIARKAADLLGGKFFPLDETRGMYRILLTGNDGQMDVVDIGKFQADTLEEDLKLRDFTINAMAVRLHDPVKLIDPLNGKKDLQDHILRTCAAHSLKNDPVRVIRAARLALAFDLRLAPELLATIRSASLLLPETSAERRRDEFYKILDGVHPASAVRLLDSFGVLPSLLPELLDLKGVAQSAPHSMDVWEHTLASMDQLNRLLDLFLSPVSILADGGNLTLGLAAGKLGKYRVAIQEHYQHALNLFRTRKSLNLMGALLHDIGKPQTKTMDSDGKIHFYRHENLGADLAYKRAQEMAHSEIESVALSKMVAFHMRPRLFSKQERLPSRRSVYRFFLQAKEFGVDICFLSLADYLAKTAYPPDQEAWGLELDRIAVYMEGWFNQKEKWVEPFRLLNGEEIMAAFN
ncbi:MAG TPA: HDIG domain-containing protein, partial [Leptolinea sp.]